MQLSETVGKDLGDMSKCKEEDDKEEAEFQVKFGERPPSQVCATMWKDLENYRGYHEQGVSTGREGGRGEGRGRGRGRGEEGEGERRGRGRGGGGERN